MVDDIGFSDIGCYGGEVVTPNLDSLAADGLRFTQFYNCSKCETTRSTLLSGKYYPVKNTQLENCITIPEGLKSAGDKTMMTGKWHVGGTPNGRGFEKYFGHLSGACNFFLQVMTRFASTRKCSKFPKPVFIPPTQTRTTQFDFLTKPKKNRPTNRSFHTSPTTSRTTRSKLPRRGVEVPRQVQNRLG